MESDRCKSHQIFALISLECTRGQLDEAHNIKERSTNTAKACFELDSNYKWCLSGTPLQNRVGELYSLIRFLGGDPFAFYFCKSFSHYLIISHKVVLQARNAIVNLSTGNFRIRRIVTVCIPCPSLGPCRVLNACFVVCDHSPMQHVGYCSSV